MKNFILVTSFLMAAIMAGHSQGCLPEGIQFTNQDQIDQFQTNYPGCTEIEGDVTISGVEITSLNGLNVLITIMGNLSIIGNNMLTSLEGLSDLSLISEDLIINSNASLTDLVIPNLLSVGETLRIDSNPTLINFNGLGSLVTVGGDLIITYNNELNSFWGGLYSVTAIGGSLTINGNNELSGLLGIANLNSVGGDINIGYNNLLSNLIDLNVLTTIGGSLNIEYNNNLSSLNGLSNIDKNTIENINISNNSSLFWCEVNSICEYLAAPNGTIYLSDNAEGCNSPDEILEACSNQQGCLPEGITFTTQDQINNFQANYPGCTDIIGNVKITDWGSEITNLNGLDLLKSVGGNLEIYENGGLTSFTGLDNLAFVGGWFKIGNGFYGGNYYLTNLSGLNNLTSIGGGLGILYQDNLLNITALEGLTFIGGELSIFGNEVLTNLTGLDNVSSIGGDLQIHQNKVLSNLSGLENINSIAGDFYMNGNDSLTNINSLINLTSVTGNVWILDNDNLTSIAGLNNIDASSIESLKIEHNNNLSDCDVQSICNYLSDPGENIEIYSNSTGCNSVEEVEAACLTSIDKNKTGTEIMIYPNPAGDFITININENQQATQVIIYNQLGQKLLITNPESKILDVSMLPSGLYLLEIAFENLVFRDKLLIE